MSSTPWSEKTAHSEKGEQTMQQLLAAAQKLFAEKGFRGTSIRDIVKEAGSNVAAVNYHFGSKENLYREVFRRHKIMARERGLAAVQELVEKSSGHPDLHAVLEAYVSAAREERHDSDRRDWLRLMNGELAEPRLDPRFLIDEIIEPLQRGLGGAIAAACPELSPKTVRMCLHSFLAQLMHLTQIQIYFGDLDAEELPVLDREEAVRHIVRFTRAGIQALTKENP